MSFKIVQHHVSAFVKRFGTPEAIFERVRPDRWLMQNMRDELKRITRFVRALLMARAAKINTTYTPPPRATGSYGGASGWSRGRYNYADSTTWPMRFALAVAPRLHAPARAWRKPSPPAIPRWAACAERLAALARISAAPDSYVHKLAHAMAKRAALNQKPFRDERNALLASAAAHLVEAHRILDRAAKRRAPAQPAKSALWHAVVIDISDYLNRYAPDVRRPRALAVNSA